MARQISIDAINAINTWQKFKRDNTEVTISRYPNGVMARLWLHGNCIAIVQSSGGKRTIQLFTRGWHTMTTKERLNAVLFYCNPGSGNYRTRIKGGEMMLEKYTVIKGVSDETWTKPFEEGWTLECAL